MEIRNNQNELDSSQKLQLYTDYKSTPFNGSAVFSDGSVRYRCPAEPMPGDTVKIRCRTGRSNVKEVYLAANGQRYPMKVTRSDKWFDFYETEITVDNNTVNYYFELHSGLSVVYYDRKGVVDNHEDYAAFKIIPGFKTPVWAKGAVMYQIFMDRFCNGDSSNDVYDGEYTYIGEPVTRVTEWDKYPEPMDVRSFYGGDIEGVMSKLDYLEWLGVEVIYFNPLFVSPSSHKYDIQDYDYIDPHFGRIVADDVTLSPEERYAMRVTDRRNLDAGNELFARLVEEAHKRGIRVILDGVFNHCGSFNKWLDADRIYEGREGYDEGAYISADSPYRTFFRFNDESAWPYNRSYDGWWGHDTLPKLNYEGSDKLYNYIMEIAKKWVEAPYGIDGWRLDVAADLGYSEEFNHKFWKDFRKSVKEANPDTLILAEHYGNPESWLRGDEWDSVMNYDAFMEPLSWFLTGMEKHSDEYRDDLRGNSNAFFGAMREHMLKMSTPSLEVAMNELSNHDHSRFLTRTNRKVGRTDSAGPWEAGQGVMPSLMRAGVIVQMTWPGAPTVYYGDEAGVCGWTDPDNRRTYPWGHEDTMMLHFHKEMIRIHRDYDALRTGSLLFLNELQDVICYGRFDDKDQFVIAVNSGNSVREFDVPVWRLGLPDNLATMVSLMLSTESEYSIGARVYNIREGFIHVVLYPYSSVVIKNMAI